jgi:sarcosine/dimethylglycine N-methyltransferase
VSTQYDQATQTARDYYNSTDADTFYAEVWGGEDIHIGLYEHPDEPIRDASRRSVDHMIDRLGDIPDGALVLDIGAGYGGAARRIATRTGASVVCLNLSEAENERNRAFNKEAGLEERITVVDGRFEDIPITDASIDLVWSQDAILHSGDRRRVLQEVDRVMKPGARFVFTDPMRRDDAPLDRLGPILERIHLPDLGSPGFYKDVGRCLGWIDLGFEDMTHQLRNHYQRVLETTTEQEPRLEGTISRAYIERMKQGLTRWTAGADEGLLSWGVFLFEKP